MKVVALVNEYPKVTHTFVRNELDALEQAGLEVERVSIRPAPMPLVDPADRAERLRTRVVLDVGIVGLLAALVRLAVTRPRRFIDALVTAVRLGGRSDRGVAYYLAYLAEACVLQGWFAGGSVAHVHAHFGSNPAAVALLWRKLGGPPYSFTAHGPEEFERAPLLAMTEKIAAAAFVVAVSEDGRRRLQELCPASDWPRLHVVRCGIDPRFGDLPATPVPSDRSIVFVGRLCAEKAPLVLLDAMALLRDAGEDCTLVMAGDGPLRAEVEAKRQKLGLQAQVKLLGWASVDDVRQHILAARALVLPSFAEGLPVVLMEALALHRPVIATPVGGVAELVEDGISGWLIPPGRADSLATAIRTVLDTPPSRLQQMGDHGAARVRQQHDVGASGRRLAELMRGAG